MTFDIDAEGIVNVSAKDLETNKEQRVEIIATSGLSDYEIDKLLRDKSLEEEQRRSRERRRGVGVEIPESVDDDAEIAASREKLKGSIFMTQVKLNTEAKKFKGRGRAFLEDSLESARHALENGKTIVDIETALEDLLKKAEAMEEYLESLW